MLLGDGATLAYHRLVLATGAVTHDSGVPRIARHAFALKELGEAVAPRNHLLCQFEQAAADPATIDTAR